MNKFNHFYKQIINEAERYRTRRFRTIDFDENGKQVNTPWTDGNGNVLEDQPEEPKPKKKVPEHMKRPVGFRLKFPEPSLVTGSRFKEFGKTPEEAYKNHWMDWYKRKGNPADLNPPRDYGLSDDLLDKLWDSVPESPDDWDDYL